MTEAAVQKGPKLTIKDVAGRLDKVVDSTNTAMTELKASMAEQAESMATQNKAILDMLQSKQAPVTIQKTHEADEQDLGAVAEIGDSPIIEGHFDLNSPRFENKMAIERFMKEKLTIHIHESNNDLEVDTFFAAVNGDKWLFNFGVTYPDIPRYIVETLARAKPITYSNVEKLNPQGVMYTQNKGSRGLRYPFSLVGATQLDHSWLNLVLAQH